MDFFNDLGKKFTKAARSMQVFTRDSAENTRLTADLRSARGELEQHYAELGRAYYESLGSPEAEIPVELIDRVRTTLERIDELIAQRDRRVRCPGCGAVQAPEARFCSNCGRRMPEDAPEPASDDDPDYCPECGAMKRDGEAYCAVCGRPFAKESAALPPAEQVPKPKAPRPEPLEEPERFDE